MVLLLHSIAYFSCLTKIIAKSLVLTIQTLSKHKLVCCEAGKQ